MRGEWCYWESYFPVYKCEQLISELRETAVCSPTIGYDGVDSNKYRDSKISWLDTTKYQYLYDEIWNLCAVSNKEWFNFDVNGMENIQFSHYRSGGKGFYKKHQDVFWINPSENHRKITCVIQLSDENTYSGGNLIFHDCSEYPDQTNIRKQGTVIFFPSFVFHEVEQVLDGDRFSLVCWIYGPKWK